MSNIKTITPISCPHCQGGIFVEFINREPEFSSVFTPEEMNKAKEDAKLRIEVLAIDNEKKQQVITWIEDENTIFAPAEVDEIIKSLVTNGNEKSKEI